MAAMGGNSDKTVRIFNAASGELRCRYRFSGSQIVDVDFSKDDRQAAVGSLDAAFAVIDTTTGQLVYELHEPGMRMQQTAISPTSETAASLATVSGAGTELQIWDLKTKKDAEAPHSKGHGAIPGGIRFHGRWPTSPDGQSAWPLRPLEGFGW